MLPIVDFSNVSNVTIMVVGDVMIDEYFFGTISRLSPEAPVPILDITSTRRSLGGAANVAANIAALGAKSVICSYVGHDSVSESLINLFQSSGVNNEGILFSDTRCTTIKQRFISNGKQLLRADTEDCFNISYDEEVDLIKSIDDMFDKYSPSVMILQDYNKGVLTPKVIRKTVDMANDRHIKVCVDPKKNNFDCYDGVYLFKPNEKELSDYLRVSKLDEHYLGTFLPDFQMNHNIENILLTRGAKGVVLSSDFGRHIEIIPAEVRQVADVTGAGDTVISTIALCVALCIPISESASIANIAGGLVCEKVGVATVTVDELSDGLSKYSSKRQ